MLKKLLQLIKQNRPQAILVAAVLLLVGVGVGTARADWLGIGSFAESAVSMLVGGIAQILLWLLGLLLSLLIKAVVWVASYNDFAGSPVVTNGWVMMRDFANMGLVIGLLYTAFRAVFSSDSDYNISSNLGKLVIASILVNFSKTITLIAVDISQVVMMSFVNSFKDVGAGNLYNILGLETFFSEKTDTTTERPGLLGAAAGLLAAVLVVCIVLGVLFAMFCVLVVRIIAIWFLIVLSPLAMMASSVKFGFAQQIKSKWTTNLTEWLTLGPMLAFVIWLTFTSMQQFAISDFPADGQSALGDFFDFEQLMGFVFSVGMLLYGLQTAIKMSGSAGSAFNKAYGFASKRFGIPEASWEGAQNFVRNRAMNTGQLISAGGRGLVGVGRSWKNDTLMQDSISNLKSVRDATTGKIGGMLAGAGDIPGAVVDRYKQSGVLGVLGAGIGATSRGTKKAANTLKYGSVSGYAGALWRQGVQGESGAVADQKHHANEHEVADKEKEYEKMGDNALLAMANHAKNGTMPDMTAMEAMAIMRVMGKKGKLTDVDQINTFEDAIKKMGGDSHYITEEFDKLRKKALPEKSIQKIQEFTTDADGKQVPNIGKEIAKIGDNASGLTHLNMAENVLFKTDHKKDWRKPGETGVDPTNQAYQKSKAQLLGLNAQAVAQSPEEFKENLKDYLMNMMAQGFDNDGKSILSDSERTKIEQLLGATQADGQAVKTAQSQEQIDKILKKGVTSFTDKHADYVASRDKHTDPAHTPSVRGRRERAVSAVDKLRRSSDRLKELTDKEKSKTLTTAEAAELKNGIDSVTGLKFRSEVDAENDIAKLIKGEKIEGIDTGDLTKEELALYAGSHAIVQNQNSGRARRAAEREAQAQATRAREMVETTAKNASKQALQNQINAIAQTAASESDVLTNLNASGVDTSLFSAKEVTGMITGAMKTKQQQATQRSNQFQKQFENAVRNYNKSLIDAFVQNLPTTTSDMDAIQQMQSSGLQIDDVNKIAQQIRTARQNKTRTSSQQSDADWRSIAQDISKTLIEEAITTAPDNWTADQVIADIQDNGALLPTQNLIEYTKQVQRRLDQQRKNKKP